MTKPSASPPAAAAAAAAAAMEPPFEGPAETQTPADDDHMEPDRFNDSDSALGDESSLATSTTSIMSEITKYHYEHGRRYHAYKGGTYLYPNDEQALSQMDIEHHNQGLMLEGRLHFAPIVANPTDIIDIGTGTGIWVIDMADKYPDATVIGTDLSPTQPTWVPPNVKFEIDDLRDDWLYGENRFDLIHCRFLFGSIDSFPRFLGQALAALKPGGWLEQNEVETAVYCDDGTFPEDSSYALWAKEILRAFEQIGRPWPKGPELKKLFEEAGFVNVQVKELKRPINDWPKDKRLKQIGKYTWLNYMEGLEGFTLGPFTRLLGWQEDEVQILIAKIRAEFSNRRFHGYQKGWVVWGQKPQ